MKALREPNTLVAFEMRFKMSSSSESEEEMINPRYVKEELNVIRVPFERMIGAVLVVVLSILLFGMWRTSVFDFFGGTSVCL